MTKRIALITGVSRLEGLGYATAKALLELDYIVIISGRNNIAALAGAVPIQLDIADEKSVQNAARIIEEKYGHIDLLINNASLMLTEFSEIEDKDMAELTAEINTNFTGTWRVTKYFAPLLRKGTHARIVNISSSMGSVTTQGWGLLEFSRSSIPAYSLTKQITNGLTIKMARDLKKDNILVNAICPGFTATRPGMKEMGARPIEESVPGIIWAATLPDDGPTGGFFRDGAIVEW